MCGICGIVGRPDRAAVERMAQKMIHRGPDSDGFYSDGEVALGMRRLKIIDLNTGDQPIHNEDKTVWVVFNGEIYNFKELRRDLLKDGHIFYTWSDTEVIVHLYEKYGEDFPNYLRGMFAVCIWDSREKQVLLARDRVGIKPLYYYANNNRLVFASEIKALLESGAVAPRVDFTSLDYYLSFLYVPAPRTIFKDIQKLLPGHILSFKNGTVKIRQYWELPARKYDFKNEKQYVYLIRHLLGEIIRQHMISDVPLGAFLSGGLDSSCVVGLMSKMVKFPIKTFSIGFEKTYASYNELEYSRMVAKHFRCDHREFILRPDIKETIGSVVDFLDEPFADSSAILNFLICNKARQFVTVALSGIGGDEVFGGYPRYLGAMSTGWLEKIPLFLRRGLVESSRLIPESRRSGNSGGRLKRYLSAATLSREEKYLSWISVFSPQAKKSLYGDILQVYLRDNPRPVHFDYFSYIGERDFADRANYVDIHTYLPDDLLVMADRMSMANSLELRVPLCDHELIEFVFNIPFSRKLKGFRLKGLFKEALKDLLPAPILHKRKQGFMVPLGDWLRNDLKGFVREVLSEENIRKRGWFNPRAVTSLLEEHLRGRQVNTHRIWALFILELWLKKNQEKI